MTTHEHVDRISAPVESVPSQTRRRVAAPDGDRIIRQIEAIDAWNTARQMRESLLGSASGSRIDREAVKRQRDALRCTHQALVACAARELARDGGPMRLPAATAVIAHRHAWFRQRVALLLEAQGVTVVECTDNGAEALGAVVAEQPDLVLAGDRLAMMPGDVLLSETRLFSPASVRAVQASDPQQADVWLAQVDAVFLRHHTPGHVADALGALRLV